MSNHRQHHARHNEHHHQDQRGEGKRYAQSSPYGAVQSSNSANYAYAGQEDKHKQHEHMAELGALGAGAFAMYEAHEVKVDIAHAGRHRIEESIAGAAVLGLSGYALHEHQKVRHDHKLQAATAYPQGQQGGHVKHHHGLFK